MHESERVPVESDATLSMVDFSKLPLEAVLGSDDSVLANSVRSVVQATRRPGESYSAHGSTP